LAWHIALRIGSSDAGWPAYPLAAAMFMLWFPAVIRTARRQTVREASGQRRAARWVFPAVCVVYAFVNMWYLPESIELRAPVAASAHLAAFYAVAAAMLFSPQYLANRLDAGSRKRRP
jgi:hypothetical protein